ncbi:uncharacterized protein MYCGRDRAFT_94809 [Zymoseptoria tritici IPO323]|uniref:Uncharacterized protein n=1 Tax=Zymoseptoria tritici (strain CBS 115943 / IPO323) TaxID=336722 RepID=F9XF82_ZYMTI|nr:uncharacterized protein MYCGRDRAFT_94809 [Zymoseptoria tritici IPO323]EGP85883.1 hypothetical protein MYCGRDRAFT_94809 [Zymoseptoria tritici IPO323]
MASIMNLPPVVSRRISFFIIPDAHIKVQRKTRIANLYDVYHVALLNGPAWTDFHSLKRTSKAVQAFYNHEYNMLISGNSLSIVMDMVVHAVDPTLPLPISFLGPVAPLPFLQAFTRLQVNTTYTIEEKIRPGSSIESDIAVENVTATYCLHSPSSPAAPLPGRADDLLAITFENLHTKAKPDSDMAFAIAAIDGLEWAIRHQLVAQGHVPTPYLPAVNARGLYHLGLLFTDRAILCAEAMEAVTQAQPRFVIGDHACGVEWQRWVEEIEESDLDDDTNEEDGAGGEDVDGSHEEKDPKCHSRSKLGENVYNEHGLSTEYDADDEKGFGRL